MQNVALLGCGWLGLELATVLVSEGYSVRGSARSERSMQRMQDAGISGFVYEIGQALPLGLVTQADAVICAFPLPKSLTNSELEAFAQALRNSVSPHTQLIFTSSTSVYADRNEQLDESSTTLELENVNYRMEQALRIVFGQGLTVLRLGGLLGEDRHPVFHLAGKTALSKGNAPVNLVHRRDVIRFISLLLRNTPEQPVYNLVYPHHPSRSEYYTNKALELALPTPHFQTDATSGKLILSDLSTRFCDFGYQFPI